MIIDLTDRLLAKQQPKPPEIGRYSISTLWGVLNGYSTPEEYIKGEDVDFKSALRMRLGSLKHDLIQEFLIPEYEIEKKTEYKYKDFVLVGKCDAINKTQILEIKTSDEIIPEAKRWHIWQVKMYLSLFKKEKGVIVQPIITASKLFLKEIGCVEKNDIWFKKEMLKIDILHKQLAEIKCQKKA